MHRLPPNFTRTHTLFPYPTLCRSWLDASNAACVTPSAARPDMFDRKVTMSGVVSPVEALSSDVVMPSVPNDAALKPAMRHSWRVISTVERSEEHTSELQALMRNSYADIRLKKKN